MLFGKIDIDLVLAGFYAQLKPATRDVLHVISAIANFKTGKFFHPEASIGSLAGCSDRSVRRAFQELLHPPWLPTDHEQQGMRGIISITEVRPGRPTVYVYNFLADAEDRGGYSTDDPRAAWDPEFLPPPPMSTPADTCVQTPRPPMSTKQEQQSLFKTTAADCLPKSLIIRMRQKYGDKIVDVVFSAMKAMNGEVKNPPGYFTACCKNGWIPSSKEARQREKKQAREEADRLRQEESKRERQKLEQEEAQRQELDALFNTLSEDQKDQVLQDATENAKSIEGITAGMQGFQMVVLSEEYKILRKMRQQ